MQDVADTKGNVTLLNTLGFRPGLVNAFFFADKLRHIFGSTPFEWLHMVLQGLYKYQVDSFHDMIGEKDAGKIRSVTAITSDSRNLALRTAISDMENIFRQ